MRSNELFTTINFVLSQFVEPFLQVLRYTAGLLLDQPISERAKDEVETIAQSMVVLIDLYNDLSCQDLPPALEDSHAEFFGDEKGMFVRFPPVLLQENLFIEAKIACSTWKDWFRVSSCFMLRAISHYVS